MITSDTNEVQRTFGERLREQLAEIRQEPWRGDVVKAIRRSPFAVRNLSMPDKC